MYQRYNPDLSQREAIQGLKGIITLPILREYVVTGSKNYVISDIVDAQHIGEVKKETGKPFKVGEVSGLVVRILDRVDNGGFLYAAGFQFTPTPEQLVDMGFDPAIAKIKDVALPLQIGIQETTKRGDAPRTYGLSVYASGFNQAVCNIVSTDEAQVEKRAREWAHSLEEAIREVLPGK